MPWLFRPLSTLVASPLVYFVVGFYVRAQTLGWDAGAWQATVKELGQLYLDFTLPALGLVLLILLPVDYVLRRVDFGLTTIAISPFVAGLTVFILGDVTSEPHVQKWAAALPLFVVYGLVWGLTIRDPSTIKGATPRPA